MRRLPLALVALVLLALSGGLATACGGGQEVAPTTGTPTDAELRQRLAELSPEDVLALAFPGTAFQPLPGEAAATFLAPAHPGLQVDVLGHLVGHLTRSDQAQLATFLYLKGSTGGQGATPPQGLPEGLYMVLAGIDSGRPALEGLSVLEASAGEFVDVPLAQEEGSLPFRQDTEGAANAAIQPAVASDVDNDGIDELVLLQAGVSQDVKSVAYLIFHWSGAGLRWDRIDADGADPHLPSEAALDYLAAVEAADGTAQGWEGQPRVVAWEWLTTTPANPISANLLAQLAADSSAEAQAAARRKLEATRSLLETAYGLFSTGWQAQKPWTAFVYGFRNATGVRVEQLLPPRQEGEQTLVEVDIIATSREGPTPVDRRFRVTYTAVEEGAGWRLDSADAHKESLP